MPPGGNLERKGIETARASTRKGFNPILSLVSSMSEHSNVRAQVIFHLHTTVLYKQIQQTVERQLIAIPQHWRRLYASTRLYITWSSAYLIYALVKRCLPVDSILKYVFDAPLPGRCYLPGRAIIYGHPVETEIIVMCSALHLSYRYVQLIHRRSLRVDLFEFLLTPEEDIQQLKGADEQYRVRMPTRELNSLTLSQRRWPIRPNRTIESHRVLSKTLSMITLIGVINSTFIVGTVMIYDLIRGFSNFTYLARYPGCNPAMTQLAQADQLSTWRLHLNWHRLLAIPLDTAEQLSTGLSTLGAVCIIPLLMFLLTFDLIIYAHQMGQKIIDLHSHQLSLRNALRQTGEMDESIWELQIVVRDFFSLMKETNHLMNVLLSSAVIVWLAITAFFTHVAATSAQAIPPIYLWLRTIALVTILGVSFLPIHLNRSLMVTYKCICSVMADESCSLGHRQRFRRMLEYFTGCHKASFTIFHQVPFTFSTFLRILGWTFTCSILFADLIKDWSSK